MSEKTATTERKYFDLHTTGIGYLNRIREVRPKKGEPFLACDIAALTGSSDDVQYVRFDCRVSGESAQKIVRLCENAVNAEKKVLIGFTIGDLWTDIFTFEKGEKKGQQGVSLKARLLYIGWVKVDGKEVYKAEPKPKTEPEQNDGTDISNTELSSPQDGDETETETGTVAEVAAEPETTA